RPGINDHLSPQENLEAARALAGRRHGLSVLQALDQVGLRRHAFRPCGRLSSGQRRRTALARLLLQQASVWVLDEPLTGLDSAGQGLIEALMLRHIDAGGACLFTTHQPLSGLSRRLRRLDLAA
ncbi:MAG TPA: ATP-binding cassette domain-containing protein, partial [Gammaproteobacteria bacterium]|nr:ATP-binding cassette domain-containing protein [Gammaproteobacteria bacterium]